MHYDLSIGTGSRGSELKHPFLERLCDELLATAMQLPPSLAVWKNPQAIADLCQCHGGDDNWLPFWAFNQLRTVGEGCGRMTSEITLVSTTIIR